MSTKTHHNLILLTISFILVILVNKLSGSPPPFFQQQQTIQEISKDTSTSEKRSGVIRELIRIVQDINDISSEDNQTIYLKQYAAEKLGDLGAIEAKDTLKAVAEKLEWNDKTSQLKRTVSLAYWKISVSHEPNNVSQEELLIKLLGSNHEPPFADVVPSWAVNELANRGVEKALPDIINRIRIIFVDKDADSWILLCKTKIKLLSNNKSRRNALTNALSIEDPNLSHQLKSWAIEELGKLNNNESRAVLISYALNLQKKYYEENGKLILRKNDIVSIHAGEYYRNIIQILHNSTMEEPEIKATGLQPEKFFLTAP
jgi:hypothetical protein